jgi:acyl-CoA synthetase (NDP forming)
MLEYEIYNWLKAHQINTAPYKVVALKEDIWIDFYPVALKIQSPAITHKSEVGGVIVNIENKTALTAAKKTMLASLAKHGIVPTEQDRFLVTKMCSGPELFFGVVNDPVFEKVIVFGAGGTYTELFKDICFIDSEAEEEEIIRAIRQTRISRLFTQGFRGKKYNLQLVVDLIKKMQMLDVQELDLNPVILQEDSLTVVDARMLPQTTGNNLKKLKCSQALFNPGKIAIIGVSSHEEKAGYALAKNTCNHPDVYFVNPHLDCLLGKKVYNTIEDLPPIDTAVIAIPAPAVAATIQQLVTRQVKNIIVITAGFKECGADEHFLTAIANDYKINITGPNCLGIYTGGINLTFGTSHVKQGQVNLFSQSGAIIAELMDKAALKNIGFENIYSVGNMADIDFGDLINSYAGSNPINLYIEGIANGKNLLRAIRKSASPVKIFKAGQTEVARKAAFSHTGNLAGNYEMFVGLLKSCGATMLKDMNGLLYPHHFERILVITNAGGAGTVISDLAGDKLYQLNSNDKEALGKVLPANWSNNNPVDIIGDAGPDRYLEALKVADGFGADAIYVIVTPQFMTDADGISKIFTSQKFRTKVFPVLLGGEMMQQAKVYLQQHEVDFFEDLNEAVSFL